MFKNLKRKAKKGFTLIELIIVIAIIAILAAIAVPAFGQIRERATVSADIGSARTIYSVVTAELAANNIELGTGEGDPLNLTDFTLVDTTPLKNLVDPMPKVQAYQDSEFTVSVDDLGNVQIYVDDEDGTSIEIYPKAAGKYADQQN